MVIFYADILLFYYYADILLFFIINFIIFLPCLYTPSKNLKLLVGIST